MRRREFIAGLGAATWPLVAGAQQPAIPVIGVLHSQAPGPYAPMVEGFRRGLREAGYIEGQDLLVEYRWAGNQLDRLPELAADLVQRRVAAIVVSGSTGPAVAAKAATSTIPIILAFGADPVELGLVASLNRPGNNITGFSFFSGSGSPKRLQLVHEMAPRAKVIGYLAGAQTGAGQITEMLAAADLLGCKLVVLSARSEGDFEGAFATLVERGGSALVAGADPLLTAGRDKLIALAARQKIPAIYTLREYADDGGLMSYGASQVDTWRKAAGYVARILNGATPSELPIQLPTKYDLVINLKTAKALRLTIPETLLATADEVIQ